MVDQLKFLLYDENTAVPELSKVRRSQIAWQRKVSQEMLHN